MRSLPFNPLQDMKRTLLLLTIASLMTTLTFAGPIHLAARNGDIEAVKQHLADGADVNAKDKYGRTPLTHAAQFGRKEVAELLIANGADVNVKRNDGWTPLHTATKEIAELLIAAGADLNAKDKYGGTPLDVAILMKKTETADILRKHGGKTAKELKAEGK